MGCASRPSYPWQKNQDISLLTWKGGDRDPLAENPGNFYSRHPTRSITEHLAMCVPQRNVASQVCSLLTRVGLLHLSVGQIVIELTVPLPCLSTGPCAEDMAVNKANSLLSETSRCNASNEQGCEQTHTFSGCEEALLEAAAQLKSNPGWVVRGSLSQEVLLQLCQAPVWRPKHAL